MKMLKNIVRGEYKDYVWHELVFDDGHNNGFGFPCDPLSGVVSNDLSEDARKNLKYCLDHPEKFVRYNEVVRYKDRYYEPGRGTCRCGETVVLENQYLGACQCPRCGSWYNLFGQELLPPEYWEDDEA